MRARMALKLAEIAVEIREVSLSNKPQHMLQVSPKGTVPVLVLPSGEVIDESLEIMLFALKAHALGANIHMGAGALIAENDSTFKRALDAYKYPKRSPSTMQTETQTQEQHRADGEVFLQKLENNLLKNHYLFADKPSFADYAIFPFIRQFAAVDNVWWQAAPYPKLQAWLNALVSASLFASIMEKQPTYIE